MPLIENFDNTPPDKKAVPAFTYTSDYADVKLIRGDELDDRVPPHTQGLDGISGSESFEDFELQDPVVNPLPGNDVGGNLVFTDWQEWLNSGAAGFTTTKCAIESYGGVKGVELNGARDTSDSTRYGDLNTNIGMGPAALLLPIKNADISWTKIRIGILAAFTGESSPGDGTFRMGIAKTPTAKYAIDQVSAELSFDTLVYNAGGDRWETSFEATKGRVSSVTSGGAPNHTASLTESTSSGNDSGYYRWLGNAGTSLFPVIVEITRTASSDVVFGMKMFIGTSSGAAGIDQPGFETLMKAAIDSCSHTGHGYETFGDATGDGAGADYNHFIIESFFPGLWVPLFAYQVLENDAS